MQVVALVPDVMDRSRIAAAVPDVEFATAAHACAHADIVIIDLARRADDVLVVRHHAPSARIIAFGPHVDSASFETAHEAGADVVLPRSRFFRDIAGALA
jgi:hypothetical protein